MTTYKDSGVNYEPVDEFKRRAQEYGKNTTKNIQRLQRLGLRVVEDSFGESALLIEYSAGTVSYYMAHLVEGLGTKNLVADEMRKLTKHAEEMRRATGKLYYDNIAQCAVAMMVNDAATLAAMPVNAAMYLAVGNSNWFKDKERWENLLSGWYKACNISECVYGAGETPVLKGVINSSTFDIGGSVLGIVKPRERYDNFGLKEGDAIVLIASSGIHANGLTLTRSIAKSLPNGYLTDMGNGQSFGGALLEPTIIYVPLVRDCFEKGAVIHYMSHITGHGWRKIMRAKNPFTYVMDNVPELPLIFQFIQRAGGIDIKEMYGTFNNGFGYAVYCAQEDVEKIIISARQNGMSAIAAGHVEVGPKRVIIKRGGKEDIVFEGEELNIR